MCRTPLDNTRVPLSYTCSYNGGPAEDCEDQPLNVNTTACMLCLPPGGPGPVVAIDVETLPAAGTVDLTITVSTPGGQSESSTVTLAVTGEEGER